jgi:predicted AAA+ superfamily ATPase
MWLKSAGLIHLSYNISAPNIPIEHYCDKKSFKVFGIDIGLLGVMSHLPLKSILDEDRLFSEFKGALTENFVAQQLTAHGYDRFDYWTSASTAEVDFVVDEELSIFPLEVKAGVNIGHKKSLMTYNEKYNPDILSRASLLNLSVDGKLINYPIYAIHLFPKLSNQSIALITKSV